MRSDIAKPKIVIILQWIHLFVFIAVVGIISLLYYYPENLLDFLRLPLFLREIDLLIGQDWPASLHVYQIVLIFSLILVFIDALGLLFYRSKLWRMVSDVSSFLGFLIIWPVALFFIFTLSSFNNISLQNIHTALIYFFFSFLLFVLDLITWFVDEQSFLVKKLARKE